MRGALFKTLMDSVYRVRIQKKSAQMQIDAHSSMHASPVGRAISIYRMRNHAEPEVACEEPSAPGRSAKLKASEL